MRRGAVPAAFVFFIGLGQSVSGIQSSLIGIALMLLEGILGGFYVLTSEVVRHRPLIAPVLAFFGVSEPAIAVPEIVAADVVYGGGPAVLTAITVIGPNRRTQHPMVEFAAIPLANVSDSGKPEAVFRNVSASVQLVDLHGHELDRAHGRWREIAQPHMHVNPGVPAGMEPPAGQITLFPNEQDHLLDVVGWDAGDTRGDTCILVRDPLNAMFRRESHRLTQGQYQLSVTLRGTNIDRGLAFRYQLDVVPPPPDWPSDRIWQPVKLTALDPG